MNKIYAAIAAAVLVAGCATLPPKELTPLEKICEDQKWECTGIAEPIVVKSQIVVTIQKILYGPGATLYGFYVRGEPYIFINPTLTSEKQEETILHETVHYLVDKLGISLSRCDNEELARRITARLFNKQYSDAWRAWYGCQRGPTKSMNGWGP